MLPAALTVGGLMAVLTATATAAPPRLSTSGLGPVKIGMTLKQAQQRDRTVHTTGSTYACSFWSWNDLPVNGAMVTATRGTRLDLINLYSRGLRTTRNVQVGDSLTRLRRRYKTLRRSSHPYDKAQRYYAVRGSSRGRKTTLRFTVANQAITSIQLGTNDVIRTFYECA